MEENHDPGRDDRSSQIVKSPKAKKRKIMTTAAAPSSSSVSGMGPGGDAGGNAGGQIPLQDMTNNSGNCGVIIRDDEMGVKTLVSAGGGGAVDRGDEDPDPHHSSQQQPLPPSRLLTIKDGFLVSPAASGHQIKFSRIKTSAKSDVGKPSSPSGPDDFAKLSDEMILQVFQWLPKKILAKIAVVCTRFRRCAFDEFLWRRLDLGLRAVPPGVVGMAMDRGVVALRAAKANIRTPVLSTGFGFSYPDSRLNRLLYLDLSMVSIAVPELEKLLETCRSLRKLSLEHAEISQRCLESVAKNRNLDTLHLGMTVGMTGDGIAAVLGSCRNLKELNVGWTGMAEDALCALVSALHASVERLNISGCRDTLTDADVEAVVARCPGLKELDVSDALNITQNSLDAIVGNLRRIESLSASRCYSIVPAAYLVLDSSLSMQYLNIFGVVKERGLEELRERLGKIEINKFLFTSVARPTVGIKRTSIWGIRVRD